MKLSQYIINYIINYLIKKYDKLFLIFSLYTIKFKLIIFPAIILVLIL